MRKAIAILPHDDDGIIAIGGILIQLLERGWKVEYIQLTDGRHGSNIMSPEETKKVRAEESKKEREFLGIDKFYNFDVEDGTLEKISKRKQEEIVKNLVRLIEDYKPNVIFLPGNGEGHPDHRMTYKLGRAAIKRIKISPLEVYYVVWLFPFLKQDPGHIEKVLSVQIDKWFEKKIQAIKLHASQERERKYSQLVENINAYFSRIYSTRREKTSEKVEVIAIYKVNENFKLFIKDLEQVEDVTQIFHGRREKRIVVW